MAENKPEATAAAAQTSLPGPAATPREEPFVCPEAGVSFCIGPGVERAVHGRPYERKGDDPLYRPLQIFTLDPSISKLEGSIATVKVPYEPLDPGPIGSVFEVDNDDGHQRNRRIHLEDPQVLIHSGLDPSPSDPRFHQQMVYAVASTVYASFRTALGRHIAWGFERPHGNQRLKIRPHAFEKRNAYYDKAEGEILFGYYKATPRPAGRNLPEGWVFTCLSHDIVAHETTHALLDGLRAQFTLPTCRDALAFHEAFADLIAVLQHFSYEKVVETAIRKCRGDIEGSDLLTDIGTQFGHTSPGQGSPLRTAIDAKKNGRPVRYDNAQGRYELASVLVSAIFDALITIFKRKTRPYILLATNGSGILPPGEMPDALVSILAKKASSLANQFLRIVIRAIDYCPPLGVTFGEYLRALITADETLVPDDPWHYREALIDAFRARRIYPPDVDNLSEKSLLWRSPKRKVDPCRELSFARLQFEGDPSVAAGKHELRRQACELGRLVTRSDLCDEFGLVRPGDPRLEPGAAVSLPCIHSIRSSRRAGPEGQIVFDLIAEVTQSRVVRTEDRRRKFDFYGGSTIVLDPEGKVRYVISKNLLNEDRLKRQQEFLASTEGQDFWEPRGRQLTPKQLLCLRFGDGT